MKKILWILLAVLALDLFDCAPLAEEAPEFPAAFDLRSVDTDGDGVGDRCYVMPIRAQHPLGTCWGFASIAAAEISILGSVLKDDPDAWKTLDLSEKQLAYFSHLAINDPSHPQNGEGYIVNDPTDSQQVYTAGSPILATNAFAQGIGPSYEHSEDVGTLFEYHGAGESVIDRYLDGAYRHFSYDDKDDWTIPEEYRFHQDFILVDSHILPTPAERDEKNEYH